MYRARAHLARGQALLLRLPPPRRRRPPASTRRRQANTLPGVPQLSCILSCIAGKKQHQRCTSFLVASAQRLAAAAAAAAAAAPQRRHSSMVAKPSARQRLRPLLALAAAALLGGIATDLLHASRREPQVCARRPAMPLPPAPAAAADAAAAAAPAFASAAPAAYITPPAGAAHQPTPLTLTDASRLHAGYARRVRSGTAAAQESQSNWGLAGGDGVEDGG